MTAITESPDVVALLDKVSLTPMELNASKHVVCVTGSTGIVGSHIVRRLLRSGHTVHAPVALAAAPMSLKKSLSSAPTCALTGAAAMPVVATAKRATPARLRPLCTDFFAGI